MAAAFKDANDGGDLVSIMYDYCVRSATWLVDSGNNTVTLAIKKKLGVE
jgi:heme-binding NEAT domain protein